jgi:hypothetical protein
MPMVGNASHLDMPIPQIGRVLTEMRTGYSRLNKYRNNIDQSLTPLYIFLNVGDRVNEV